MKFQIAKAGSWWDWNLGLLAAIAFLFLGMGKPILGAIPFNAGSILSAKSLVQTIPHDNDAQQAYATAEQWGIARAHLGLGRLAVERGDYQAALNHLSLYGVQSHDASDPIASYFVGVAYSQSGHVEEAVDSFVAVGAYEAVLSWAIDEFQANRVETSETILRRLIALAEGRSPETVWRAKLYLVEHARPTGDCERISQLVWELWGYYQRTGYGPPLTYFAQMFYNTARCFTNDGQILSGQPFRRARRDYEASLQAIPNYTWLSQVVYERLARGALEAGEFDDAKAWADQGLSWYPNNPLLQQISQAADVVISEENK